MRFKCYFSPVQFVGVLQPWASEEFFPEGVLVDFSKICLWGLKVVKFVFSHSKLRKQPFFAGIFKIHGEAKTPLHPSEAHDCSS